MTPHRARFIGTAVPALLMITVLGALPWSAAASDLAGAAVFSTGPRFAHRDGKALYEAICQGCHQADARGAVGAGQYPALAGNPKLASALYPAVVVINGLRAMPAFGDQLDDQQIAAVVNYLRSHFGNHHTDVLATEAITPLRPVAAP